MYTVNLAVTMKIVLIEQTYGKDLSEQKTYKMHARERTDHLGYRMPFKGGDNPVKFLLSSFRKGVLSPWEHFFFFLEWTPFQLGFGV